MTLSIFALIVFVVIIAADVAALLLDVWLAASGQRTITARCRRVPLWGMALVAWQMLGAAALLAHFAAGP